MGGWGEGEVEVTAGQLLTDWGGRRVVRLEELEGVRTYVRTYVYVCLPCSPCSFCLRVMRLPSPFE